MVFHKVEEYVSKRNMIQKEDKLIVGVSGGADSICLLFVLMELQKKLAFEMVVVHVNHGLRGEAADGDEAYVRKVCKEHGITCEVYRENVEWIAKERKQSTEEAGRHVRREAFMQTMEKYGGTKIALAHHMNDSVETFFMNLARGTGIQGMGGIRPIAGVYIRPLLCLERKEIEEFLQEKNIPYCIDATNEEDDYTRNRLRNHVIPYMEREVNTRTVAHIGETMNQLQELQIFLQEQTEIYCEQCVKQHEKGYILLESSFFKAPTSLRPFIIKRVLVQICQKEKDIHEVHLQQILELFQKQVGRQLDLPYAMQGKRTYEGVCIYKKTEPNVEPMSVQVSFEDANRQEIEWGNIKVICRLLKNDSAHTMCMEKNNTMGFDYDIITHGVCIRTRQPGDYITIHPDGRRQKLKSFFINEKIPEEKRDQILLVADGNHILWIVGFRTNCVYQVGKHTKRVLEIQMNKGEHDGRDN
ncbi:MAG: tRNA lysidine(34) synthetase TilS [Tyzzerella sp.]|nr:tRNA lysidine(34) synthetase TilS [Tyzzerella sp.]